MARRLGSNRPEGPDLDLYGILNVPKDASEEELQKAYRGLAMLCHPDKVPGNSVALKAVATEQFNRIREAFEILSDNPKRQIYDLYGMEGLTSGLEVGTHRAEASELKRAFDHAQMRRSELKLQSRVNQTSTILTSLSVRDMLTDGVKLLSSNMTSSVSAPISPKDTLVMGGTVGVRRGVGAGNNFIIWKHQASPHASYEVGAVLGIRQLLTASATRQLSKNMSATGSVNYNVKDRTFSTSLGWTRQLTPNVRGDIGLNLGADTSVGVGWSRDGTKNSFRGDVRMGGAFGVAGNWVHHFSDKSFSRVSAKIGITALELELGATRVISERSTGGFSCTVGVQGVLWKIRYTRGGQKFVFPILLSDKLEPFTILGALCIPPAVYALVRHYYLKPAAVKRSKRKMLASRRANAQKVREAIEAAQAVQGLMSGSANRKRATEEHRVSPGLVIVEAVYGCVKPSKNRQNGEDSGRGKEKEEVAHDGQDEGLPAPFLDVTIPAQFLVEDGAIKLHPGIRKAGLMGFCDPCPGEEKQLRVKYKWRNNLHETTVGDKDALSIPDRRHKLAA